MDTVRIKPERGKSSLDQLMEEIGADPAFQRVIGKKSAHLPDSASVGEVQVIGNLWLAPSDMATLLLKGIENIIGRVGGDGEENELFFTFASENKRDSRGNLDGNLAVLLAAPSAGWPQWKVRKLHDAIFTNIKTFSQVEIDGVPFLLWGKDPIPYMPHMVLETLVRYRNVGEEHARRWFGVLKNAIEVADDVEGFNGVLGKAGFVMRGVQTSAQGTRRVMKCEGTNVASTAALALLYGVFGEKDLGFIQGMETVFVKVPCVVGGASIFYDMKTKDAFPNQYASPGVNALAAMAHMMYWRSDVFLSFLTRQPIFNNHGEKGVVVSNARPGTSELLYLEDAALLALAYQMQEGEKRKRACQK